MNFEYGYHIGGEMAGFLIAYLIICLLSMGFGIVSYVLSSLGVYTIAKRRELNHPWMAWVPVLNLWTLGSISDQYQYVVHNRIRNKRKWLIGLTVAYFVILIAAYVVMLVAAAKAAIVSSADFVTGVPNVELAGTAIGFVITILAVWLVLVCFIIAMSVVRYVAMYDLYRSCNPDNAVLFLVLSILINVTEPFFIFACRKKDKGMPPRRPRHETYIPGQYGYQPQSPVYPNQPPMSQSQQAEEADEAWQSM